VERAAAADAGCQHSISWVNSEELFGGLDGGMVW